MVGNLTKYETSAIIGFWRSGAKGYLIADIIGCPVHQVLATIQIYKAIIE